MLLDLEKTNIPYVRLTWFYTSTSPQEPVSPPVTSGISVLTGPSTRPITLEDYGKDW